MHLDLALQQDVADLLDTAIWFANQDNPDMRAAVERFKEIAGIPFISLLRFRERPSFEELELAHKDLQRYCRVAIEYDRKTATEKRKIESELSDHLVLMETGGHLKFSEAAIRIALPVFLTGVPESCYLSSALLVDRDREYYKRLRECRNHECNKFFMDWGARGRPRSYCSPECSEVADKRTSAERQKRHRFKLAKMNAKNQ